MLDGHVDAPTESSGSASYGFEGAAGPAAVMPGYMGYPAHFAGIYHYPLLL